VARCVLPIARMIIGQILFGIVTVGLLGSVVFALAAGANFLGRQARRARS